MPRKNRCASETGVYHFINRGVNKRRLFYIPDDYKKYLSLTEEHARELGIEIYHYCLMSNHTHILLRAPDVRSLSRFGHYLQRRYAYYCHRVHHGPAQIFRKRFISIAIDKDAYLLECGRYIERNPIRAKLTERPEDFKHCSYSFYGLGRANILVTPNPLYESMGKTGKERMVAYRDYVVQERPYDRVVDWTLDPLKSY